MGAAENLRQLFIEQILTSMSRDQPKPVILDERHVDFIQRHVTINVSSRDANNMPTLVRGFGCRVAESGQRVTVYVPQMSGQRLLQSLAGHGMIAVVCSRPSTHEALQLKGVDAKVADLDAGDHQTVRNCFESFLVELKTLGYSDHFVNAVRSLMDEGVVAVTFTPSAAFVQTPGPQAGQSLASAS
jgi:hypothetical protein